MLVPDSAERLELDEEENCDHRTIHVPLDAAPVPIPSTRWDRHLPPHVLPTAEIHEDVLDVFFR